MSTWTQVLMTSISWGLSSLRLSLLTWHPGTNSQSYPCPSTPQPPPIPSQLTRIPHSSVPPHTCRQRPRGHHHSLQRIHPRGTQTEEQTDKWDMDVEESGSALVPRCCCDAAACWQAMQDPGERLGSGSGNEGGCCCCCPTRQRSLSLKSPSWNVSPSCHVCALAVLTGCQSTHTQTSERGQHRYTADGCCCYSWHTRFILCLQTNTQHKIKNMHAVFCNQVPVSVPGSWLMSGLKENKTSSGRLSFTGGAKWTTYGRGTSSQQKRNLIWMPFEPCIDVRAHY